MQPEMIEFPSDEERYTYDWLVEAKENGLVLDFKHQPKPFTLSDDVKIVKRIKKNGTPELKHIMFGHQYQADFVVSWNEIAILCGLTYALNVEPLKNGIIPCQVIKGKYLSVLDSKGGYVANFNDQRFTLNQKWVYKEHGIYVFKFIPFSSRNMDKCVFSQTWTPKSYFTRRKKRGDGYLKCNCNVRTIHEYLNDNSNEK